MKKWIALLLALAMLVCLCAGCGKTDAPGSTPDTTQTDTPGSDVPDETTNAELPGSRRSSFHHRGS